MKKIVVVLALLAMMVGLRLLEVEDVGGADPLTLASIGFVILASFAFAELLAHFGLPKVTGYIISGLVLGDQASGILSEPVLEQMGMFNDLALGLIALTAGLELEFKSLTKLARTLLSTTAAKVLIAAPAVGLAFLGAQLFFRPLELGSDSDALALALVFGALSVGTSPSISLAILSETGAKGRLSELVLGAAVFKDLVVVVLLAVAIAVSQSLSGGGAMEGSVLLHVAQHLALEIVAGGVVGLLLIGYLRWIKAEMLLFVAALVLVVAEVAHSFDIEALLIFITAGFVVRNFSEFEHDLHPPLALVSLPVFVVFFTVRAASLDLEATLGILPLALLLFTVRAATFWLSAKIGNRIGGEQPKVANNAWYSYLPQAGVTLGLVGVAAESLKIFEGHINTLGTAVVALNLFVGPVALRTGLRRAGELPGETGERETTTEQADAPERAQVLEPLTPELEARLVALRELIATELTIGVQARIGPWISLRRRAFANLNPESITEITALAESPPRSDAAALGNSLAALFEAAANHPQHLEISWRVPLEPRWLLIDEQDPPLRQLRIRARRLAAKLGSRAAKTRQLPMRLIAREAFEPRLATGMLELFRVSCRTEAALADTLRRRLAGTLAPADVRETLELQLAELEAKAAAIIAGVLDAGSQRMRLLLARIDSPQMSVRQLDFGEAATGIERELGTLLGEAQHWPMVIDSCWQTVEVSARIRRLDDRIAASRDSAADLLAAKLAVEEELGAFARRLRSIRDELDGKDALDEQQLDGVSTRALGLLPKPASKRLRQIEQRLRRASDSKAIQQALREAAARDTGAKELVGPELVVAAAIPAAIRTHEVDVRELIDGEIAGRLLPATERELENAARLVSDAQTAALAMVGDVELLAEVYRREEHKTLDNLRSGLERVQAHCEELLVETAEALARAAVTITTEFDGLGDRLSATLHDATGEGDPARWVSRRTDRAKRQVGRELARLRERGLAQWAVLRERGRELAAALNNDYRLRSGRDLPTAAAIAKLVQVAATPRVSRDYANLFADQPIRDPRFFVANREVLRTIGKAERHWQQHRTANALLVVGGPGSGKTSLLNVATLKLATRETLWLPEQRDGILASLAAELHCSAKLDLVVRRLLDRPRVIVIDDLERRLPLDHRAIDELELLARLIARTAASSFWLVAAQRELQQLLARHWPLRVGFAERVVLGRLDGEELAAVILARHRISHLELAFPLTPARRLLTRVLGREPGGQQRRFFAALARESGGNLRAALNEWCRAGTIQEQTLVLEPLLRTRTLPFLRQLPGTALAMLALVLRFGPSPREQLATALLRDRDELDRWLHFLLTAELLTQDEHGSYACPAHVRDVLTPELVELSIFHQEGS